MKRQTLVGIIGTIASVGRNDLLSILSEEIHNSVDALVNNFNSEEVGKAVQNAVKNILNIEPSLHYDGDDKTGVWWINKEQIGFDYIQIKISRLDVNFQGVITATVIIFKNGNTLGFAEEKKAEVLSDTLQFLREILSRARIYINEQKLTLHPDGLLS